MSNDKEHLRILSIFFYVVAGLCFLFSLVPLIHLTVGILIVNGVIGPDTADPDLQPFGWILIAVASTFILMGITFSVLLAQTGRFISSYRNHTFCVVIAGIACCFIPFGTVLGVFTIVVLMRDSVRELFGQTPAT